MTADTTQLGAQGSAVTRIGYGAMVLEGFYGSASETEAAETLRHAINLGLMVDTADAYGNGHNETLIAHTVQTADKPALIASKFGIVFEEDTDDATEVKTGWGYSLFINGRPDYVMRCIDRSLKRLDVEAVDLWYCHFPDPQVPIEETVGAMAEAVAQGKVKTLGLSNVSADQVRNAAKAHPIAAVQYEYSLWRREVEQELLPAIRNIGSTLVAWSPLGAGFFAGGQDEFSESDFRRANNPRFSDANLAANRERFAPLREIASELGISDAQLALAWLLKQGDDVLAIPGSRKIQRIDENLAALDIELDTETLRRINDCAKPKLALGGTLL